MKHRRHRRVAARGVAAHVGADMSSDCNIENISVGGLFLRTTAPMPIGMPVRVELVKQGLRSPLVVSGRVVSVVTEAESERQDIPPGVGIEFDTLPRDAEKRLHALLRELGLADLADPRSVEPDELRGTAIPDTQRVESNVRGLMSMLTDALDKLKQRDDEIVKLKAEIRRLKVVAKPASR